MTVHPLRGVATEPVPPEVWVTALDLHDAERTAAFAAIRDVLEASVSTEVRPALLAATARILGVDPGRVGPITPEQLAAVVHDRKKAYALAHVLVVAACMGGAVTSEGEEAVRAFATGLGVRSHWVDLLAPLRRQSTFAVKRALMQRSPDARRLFARTWQEEGTLGIARAVLFVAGLHRDAALAQRFRELESYPSDTLGARFFQHIRSRGLAFPGEKGGVPERMVHHDLLHVLTGYDTDGAGECQLAGFYAGFADGDAFTFIVVALATFQLGLAVSPAAVTPTVGAFDIERVARAYLRGQRLRVDVMGPWDYWPLMKLPIEEVRRVLDIEE